MLYRGQSSFAFCLAYTKSLLDSLFSLRYRLATIGVSYVSLGARVLGWRNIKLEKNIFISSGSLINVNLRSNRAVCFYMKSHSFVGRNCFVSTGSLVQISQYATISEGCKIIGASHDYSEISKHRLLAPIVDYGPLIIGVNVFIGAGTTILGGVILGHGSVIGCNSFVACSVPPFTMYAGSPAVLIKYYDHVSRKWIRSDSLPESFDEFISEEDYVSLIQKNSPPFYYPPIPYSRLGYADL